MTVLLAREGAPKNSKSNNELPNNANYETKPTSAAFSVDGRKRKIRGTSPSPPSDEDSRHDDFLKILPTT